MRTRCFPGEAKTGSFALKLEDPVIGQQSHFQIGATMSNYPFRDTYHAMRKQMIAGFDRVWPQSQFSPLLETLHFETRPPYDDIEPDILPDQAREFLNEWRKVEDIEAIYKVKEPCTVDPKMGILFKKGKVIWGSSDQPSRERSPHFFAHLGSSRRRLPSAILLHHVHGDNYFHFFLYVMNRVRLANLLALPMDIPFLVPARTAGTSWFSQAEELGAFGGRPVVVQGKREVIAVDQPYLVRSYFCHAQCFNWLSEVLGATSGSADETPVFAVRNSDAANGRTFRNQSDINKVAEAFGFKIVDPGSKPLKEQVQLFNAAPVVAGAHGAGLTNLIFRNKNRGALVEIFSPEMGSPHYYMIAREKGFSYQSFFSKAPEGRAFSASTEVDIELLKQNLDAACREV